MTNLNLDAMRPCRVYDNLLGWTNALFHGWYQISTIVPPSSLIGGHGGGSVSGVYALVEYQADGSIHKAPPENIQFLDSRKRFDIFKFEFEAARGEE